MEKPIKKQNLSKVALKGSAYNLFSLLILKFGGLIFTIILARMLLPEDFGIYSLALSIVTLAIVFTNLGIDDTFLRYFSDSIGKNNKKLSRSYFRYFLKKKIILILIIVIAILAFSKFLSYNIYEKPLLFYPLIFSCLFVFSESLKNLFGQFFPAKKDFKSPVFFNISNQLLKILFSVFAILIFTDSFKVSSVFIAFFLASFLTLILEFFVIKRKNKSLIFGKTQNFDKSKINSYWKYMVLTSLSLAFFGSVDMLMLGKFVASEYIAYYRVALSLVLTIASLFSLSTMLLPIFTQIKGKRFERGFHKTIRYVLILAIPATAGLLFLGKYLIKVIYGNEYLSGAFPLSFLVPIIVTTPLIAIYSTIFKSKEKPKSVSKAIFIAVILNVVFNLIAIFLFRNNPLYLIAGIGVSTTLSRITILAKLISSSKKHFGFKIKGLGLRKPLFATLVMSAFLFAFNKFVDINIVTGILEIILGVGIYFGVMVLIKGIKKEDFKLIQSLMKR